MLKERGAAAIGELQRLELVPDVLGTFPLGCPVCRCYTAVSANFLSLSCAAKCWPTEQSCIWKL